MRCPFCSCDDTRVIDSRLGDGGETVRRRRECLECSERFTTYERVELRLPQVIKSDGSRERFDEEKLRRGIARALEKRPIAAESVEAAVSRVLRKFSLGGDREVASREIGEAVMEQLRLLDDVAYVRFASVYRRFQDLDAFSQELQRLRESSTEVGPINPDAQDE